MIKKLLCAVSLAMLSTQAFCADNLRTLNDWVPKGWTLLKQASGDLNGDGVQDIVAVFEEADQKNFHKNDGFGQSILNTNPRILVVLFAEKGAYRKVAENASLIPPQSDLDSSCHEDPLDDISIQKGLFKLSMADWLSCGGWERTDHAYVFRFDGKGMRLIGEEESSFMRNSGEKTGVSKNYLTGKIKNVSGDNEFTKGKPKTTWETMPNNQPKYLEQIE